MAVVSRAGDKAREKLSEFHEYADQTVDRPLLSSETGEKDNE